MRRSPTCNRPLRGLLLSAAVALGAAGLLLGNGPSAAQAKEKPNRYIGADKCKMCHSSAETGDQYGSWQHDKHALVYERLASPEAKEAGKARDVADPQTSDACLRCHTTAFKLGDEQIKRGFDSKQGVQCEACHGPGEEHVKARTAAVAKGQTEGLEIPASEITAIPPAATCRGCHNADSPTYKPFCYYERVEKIRHLNPKKRTPEELAKLLVCGCGESCKCDTECVEGCPVAKGEKK